MGAKYTDLVAQLKIDILSGKYNSGKPFPSVRAIARRHACSSATAQRTLDELFHMGLISRKQGRGTFVTKEGASRKIGLIVPGIAYSEFYLPFLSEINRQATENGYALLLGEVYSNDPKARVNQVRLLANRFVNEGVAGVIYQPFELLSGAGLINQRVLSEFDSRRIPVVLVAADIVPSPERSAYDVVGINNLEAGRRLALHLKEQGVRRVAFLLNEYSNFSVQNRLIGLRSVFAETGAVKEVHSDPLDVKAVRRLVSGRGAPDAVVCRSDALAARLLTTLRVLGKNVPEDLLVAGFNDIGYAASLDLTSIKVPSADIARFAFQALRARMNDPKLIPNECMLPAPLTVRGSTTRLKKVKAGQRGHRL